LGGAFGFGIQMYDQQNLNYNKNGVYQTRLYVNENEIFNLIFDRFLFSDSKYINYLIDYKAYREEKIKINKLYLSKIGDFSFLGPTINDGKLFFLEGKKYNIKIELFDYNNNKTVVRLLVEGTIPNLINSIPLKGEFIDINIKKKFEYENKEVTFLKNSFFENQIIKIINKKDTLIVDNSNSPLNKPIKVVFKLSKLDSTTSQLGIGIINKSNKNIFLPSLITNNQLSAFSNKYGKYIITRDSIFPSIKPIGFKKGDWMSNKKYLKIHVSDDYSGIKKYHGTINGKWVLLEYEPKNKTLQYNFKDINFKNAELNIEIVVEDFAGNKSRYITKVFRKLTL